jgi:hypothetical protein
MLDAVKEAVKLWSTSLMKEFWVVKSRSDVYDVKCIRGWDFGLSSIGVMCMTLSAYTRVAHG